MSDVIVILGDAELPWNTVAANCLESAMRLCVFITQNELTGNGIGFTVAGYQREVRCGAG